jgi:hypothetical protein
MHKLPRVFLSLGLFLGVCSAAYPQSITQQNPLGSDAVLVQSGGPGGGGYPTTVQALRNATGHILVATGTTVTTTMTQAQAIAIATGAITTWNITLPANPYTGELVEVTCPGGTVTTVSVSAASSPASTTIVGTSYTSCTSGGAAANNAQWTYSTSANVWYRIN